MHILNSNFKSGKVSVLITEGDDLWYLKQLIDPGDLVKGKTTRKIRIGNSENAKVTKKTMTLTVEAETVEFGDDGASLRINGLIKDGPEDLPRDNYHAISIVEQSQITITKSTWMAYQKQKLQEASKTKYSYLFCLFDREEALIAVTQKFGYKILVKLKGSVAKKAQDVTITKDFHTELIEAIKQYNDRLQPEKIIIASPAFYKEDLFKKVKDDKIRMKTILSACSDISERSLDEVLKRPELSDALKFSRAREEQLIVDELLKEINKNNLATYGWKETSNAIKLGAISALIITEKYIQKQKEDNKFAQLDEQMRHVDALKGKIHLISSEMDSGKKVDGLGGIAALLRYKL
jgi:protein pelota